jgi:general secretion pathway protein N
MAGRATVVATSLASVVCVAAIVVASAPANWLARYLASRTHGAVLLADARGTIWSGSAVLAVAAPHEVAEPVREGAALALPGRVTWTLEFERALAPVLHLTHDGVLLQPVAARVRDGALVLDAGSLALPVSMLRLMGAPLNTLLPEGRCSLQWNGLRFAGDGPPTGEGTLRIAAFGLAISPVKPLGDYLVSWASGERGVTWQLATERGPLLLEGGGSLVGRRTQTRVVVKVAPDTPAPTVAQLNPLLDILGRRVGDQTVIEAVGGT